MARRELNPAMLTLVQAVETSLIETDRALVVACSGGTDSLALAAAAQVVTRRRSLALGAVIVDHGLQADSARVAERARQELGRIGIDDIHIVPVRVDLAAGLGPEGAARVARYAALRAEAGRAGATVLLGHTLDDQAETVLLGLARGSGTRSLAGMSTRTPPMLRPLLGVARAVTAQACDEAGLHPWLDPHNSDPAYARVRVRQSVLPVLESELGPGIAAALARTAELARDDADLLDRLTAEADPGHDELDCGVLAELPAALRSRLIRRWLLRHGAAEVGLTHVAMVEALVLSWHGQRQVDLPDLAVRRLRNQLHVVR
jgi:tRNA(Ile)-lysidine synthase